MTSRTIRPHVVYDLNGTQYLCTRIGEEGHVYLTAVRARYGKWLVGHGPSSIACLLYEYNARPAASQALAKIRLWGSWHVMPVLRRLRKRLQP